MNTPALARSRVASHEPIIGLERRVFAAIMFPGQRNKPVPQVFVVEGGYEATVTIANAVADEVLSLTIRGITVTYTVPDPAPTPAANARAFVDLLNSYDVISRTDIFAGELTAGTGTEFTFVLSGSHAFTVTEASTSLSVTAVTNSGTAIAKGATSIPLREALTGRVEPGQHVCFANNLGEERIAKMSQVCLAGATALTVAPLTQEIMPGARGEFPSYIFDRTDANISNTYNNSSYQTYDTNGETDGAPTTTERTISIPGILNMKNAGALTLQYAAENKKFVWLTVIDPPADGSGDFEPTVVIEGRALITSIPRPAPVSENMMGDFEAAFKGAAIVRTPYDTDVAS